MYGHGGKVLAEDVERYKLVTVIDKKASVNSKKPRHIVDKRETAKKLSIVINMKPEEIERRLSQKEASQIEFGRKGTNLTYQDKLKIEKMSSPGTSLLSEIEYFYLGSNFASHLIGRAQKDPDIGELEGTPRVKRVLDSHLSGPKGSLKYIHDTRGYIVSSTKKEKQPKRSNNVHLAIDLDIQVFAGGTLDDVVEKYQPKDLFTVVMDAKTGEILAYNQRPTSNPKTGKDFGKKWANDLHQNTYESGPTFKSYGLAAAIQEGAFDPDRKYKSGRRNITGLHISNWNRVGWGGIPVSLGFTYSSNILMMRLQDLVNADKMKSWHKRFGFEKSTKGMFDGEAPGQTRRSNEL